MRTSLLHLSLALVGGLFAACSSEAPAPIEDGVRIAVAPLTLPGLSKVCYDLRVTNGADGAGDVVWSKGTPGLNGGTPDGDAICSTQYGNGPGGDITYIGPCDADGPDGERMNSVTLWFDGLYDVGDAYIAPDGPQGWQNPCVDATGAQIGCTLNTLCEENADALVEFNFTILRQANQGFFDVAVNFSDVFCSAKFDCRNENGAELTLLHNGQNRDTTMVLAFACTSGADDVTYLHMSDLSVECANGTNVPTTFSVSPTPAVQPGNQGAVPPLFFQTAIYVGDESLEPYDKCYWNLALGLSDDAPANCVLKVDATASDASWLTRNGRTPDAAIYPYIHYEVPFTDGAGNLSCGRHAVNDASLRVSTRYTDFTSMTFEHERECGSECSGCLIEGQCVPAGQSRDGCAVCLPGAPCQVCRPEISATSWTTWCPDGDAQFDTQEVLEGTTYFVQNATGEAFGIALDYYNANRTSRPQPLVVRIFDPDGRLVAREEIALDKLAAGATVPTERLQFQVPAGLPGTYEVVAAGFGGELGFARSPALPYGRAGHVNWLPGFGTGLSDAYVFIPPGLTSLPIEVRRHTAGTAGDLSVRVVDALGGERLAQTRTLSTTSEQSLGAIAISPADHGTVWRFQVTSPGYRYHLGFDGAMPIFCPDAATAAAIAGHVRVLDPNGEVIAFHAFQERAYDLLEQYRARPASDFAVTLPDLEAHEVAWLADPVRNRLLLGPYGVFANLPPMLAEQNLDPESPWFGTFYVGRFATAPPFANYRRIAAFTGVKPEGAGRHVGREAAELMTIYDLDALFNPLYRSEALLNRAIIAALQDLLMIGPHELPRDNPGDHFGGSRAFAFEHHAESFALLGRYAPPEVKAVLREGQRRMIDRTLVSEVASTVNQWATIMKGIHHFYLGSGETHYLDWVRRHVRWMRERAFWGLGQMPAGYMSESHGPDSTYNGITLSELAEIYRESPDPDLLSSIESAYRFFGYSTVPEPLPLNPPTAGTASNDFAHRTPGTWWSPQYGGGLVLLAELLPEAGLREGTAWLFERLPRTEVELTTARAELEALLRYNSVSFYDATAGGADRITGGSWHARIWQHHPVAPLPGVLPANEVAPFTRNLGDELFAVKRAGYYALSYAGSPMQSWLADARPSAPNRQHTFNGGGVSLLWSPGLGASIVGRNFGAYAAHTLIAVAGTTSTWENYWSVVPTFTADPALLATTGSILSTPLSFARTLAYETDHVDQTLIITASAAVSLTSFFENLPFRPSSGTSQTPPAAALLDAEGNVTTGPVTALRFSHPNTSEVHLVIFDAPRTVELGLSANIDYKGEAREWGQAKAFLPTSWQATQSRTFKTRFAITTADQVPQAIEAFLDETSP